LDPGTKELTEVNTDSNPSLRPRRDGVDGAGMARRLEDNEVPQKDFFGFYATLVGTLRQREYQLHESTATNETRTQLQQGEIEMAAYIKFDGIDGESQDKDHKNWSNLMSVSQSLHKPGGGATGSTRRRGTVIMEDIAVTKEYDKSSPKLAEAVCLGKVFPKVEVEFTASQGDSRKTYLKYELKNVQVTSYQCSGAGQSEAVPAESFSLNYEEIKVTYTEYDSKGTKKGNVEFGWKVEEGEKA
jgi:type VI secretion system secreted protein Hcp